MWTSQRANLMETQAGNGSNEGGTESQGHRVGGARVSDVSNIHPKLLLLGYLSAWSMLPMASAEVSWLCFFSSPPYLSHAECVDFPFSLFPICWTRLLLSVSSPAWSEWPSSCYICSCYHPIGQCFRTRDCFRMQTWSNQAISWL